MASVLTTTLFRNFLFAEKVFLYGTPEGILTPDPRLRRPLLYPTELLKYIMGAGVGFEPTTSELWAQRATELLYPAKERDKIQFVKAQIE